MGGVNHQPCNKYLVESTELSRSMSLARSNFELANVAIEDVLLRELRQEALQSQSVEAACAPLIASQMNLKDMLSWLGKIALKLSEVGGWEPPTVQTTDWDEVGRQLVAIGAVEILAWERMTAARTEAGFPGVIALYERKLHSLLAATDYLRQQIENLGEAVKSRDLAEAIEQNRAGDFKILFARVYSQWAEFQQLFLASALLSTESWYRWTACGSLTGQPDVKAAA